MQAGQEVTYVDGSGKASRVTITRVEGAGPSGYKRLDLDNGKEGVFHQQDAKGAYWSEEPVRRRK